MSCKVKLILINENDDIKVCNFNVNIKPKNKLSCVISSFLGVNVIKRDLTSCVLCKENSIMYMVTKRQQANINI